MIPTEVLEPQTFQYAHTSTLCQNDRGILIAWAGRPERDQHASIWCGHQDGSRWANARPIAGGVEHTGVAQDCWNPVLVPTPAGGPTILFYKVGESPRSWRGQYVISEDHGRTWSAPHRLPQGMVGPVRSPPLWVENNTQLLCGASTEHDGWKVHFESVRYLNGQPAEEWNRTEDLNAEQYQAIQPAMLWHADGRIQSICRTNQEILTTTWSTDQGRTWTPLQPLDVQHPNSAIDAITLDDGRFWMVGNFAMPDSPLTGRQILSLLESNDGLRWHPVVSLQTKPGGEVCYPSMIQTDDGSVHVTYSDGKRAIAHAVLDPSRWSSGA